MDIQSIVIQIFVVLFAITVHEASHGWAAHKMGDPTAYASGRVTLNPLAHIDPIGTILMPIVLYVGSGGRFTFGWAKPVPVNPYNLRHPRRDNLWISFAGPAANLSVATVSLLVVLLIKAIRPRAILFLAAFLNQRQLSGGFGPLEGVVLVLFFFIVVNTYLAVFNLIPVPPLDGSHLLDAVLPPRLSWSYARLRPYGIFILFGLIWIGFFGYILSPFLHALSWILLS